MKLDEFSIGLDKRDCYDEVLSICKKHSVIGRTEAEAGGEALYLNYGDNYQEAIKVLAKLYKLGYLDWIKRMPFGLGVYINMIKEGHKK